MIQSRIQRLQRLSPGSAPRSRMLQRRDESANPVQDRHRSRAKRVKTDERTEALEEDDGPKYWLLKAEPESRIHNGKDVKFSIDDLMNVDVPEPWSGVRNYAARNHMRAMKKGGPWVLLSFQLQGAWRSRNPRGRGRGHCR